MAASINMSRAAILPIVLLLLHQLSLSYGQAVYPTNLCGFPGPDENVPIQCYYSSDGSPTSAGYACCPAKSGCCGSRGCCPFNGPVRPPPQGYCGTGAAIDFPIQCYFNSDPLHRYVCCDTAGCNGFNSDNLTPHCKNNGYVPAGFGLTPPPPPPTLPPPTPGTQGVCGTGVATSFPFRCYFNNDPAGRYICCDAAGCNGFSFVDDFYPKCAGTFYLPPNFGVGASSPTPAQPVTSPPAPSTTPGTAAPQETCDPLSTLPNQCFNADGNLYVCCPDQCPDNPGATPTCKN